MKFNVTSGPTFSFYIAIALIILVSVSDKAHAKPGTDGHIDQKSDNTQIRGYVRKGGCASFGHSCFGGHGKRFDSAVRQNMLQTNSGKNFQTSEMLPPNDELFYVLPSDGFRERPDQAFMRARKDTQQQFDPNPLSTLVNQWIASHRRSHRTDPDVTNK